jgi:hypothetical protein
MIPTPLSDSIEVYVSFVVDFDRDAGHTTQTRKAEHAAQSASRSLPSCSVNDENRIVAFYTDAAEWWLSAEVARGVKAASHWL